MTHNTVSFFLSAVTSHFFFLFKFANWVWDLSVLTSRQLAELFLLMINFPHLGIDYIHVTPGHNLSLKFFCFWSNTKDLMSFPHICISHWTGWHVRTLLCMNCICLWLVSMSLNCKLCDQIISFCPSCIIQIPHWACAHHSASVCRSSKTPSLPTLSYILNSLRKFSGLSLTGQCLIFSAKPTIKDLPTL